jgi:hypothetical protein
LAAYEERVGAELGRSVQIDQIGGFVRAEGDYLLQVAMDGGVDNGMKTIVQTE